MTSEPKTDIYTRVTNKIMADLERGTLTWRQPWNAEHLAGRICRPLRHTGQPYKGINIIMLWATAAEAGFASPLWMTFKQALELGACVRKGSKGTQVVYADRIRRSEENDRGETELREIPFLKAYTVFNVEQIDGLPAHYYHQPEPPNPNPETRLDHLDSFFRNCLADIRHGGTQAYYSITHDYVQMPPFETFVDAERYYATLAHEMTHWTRHTSRLNRDFGRKTFGDEGYAREELVAELGSAFLAAELGFAPETREDHAAYIQHWLKAMKNDKRFIFTAAAHAQRAVDFLQTRQPQTAQAA